MAIVKHEFLNRALQTCFFVENRVYTVYGWFGKEDEVKAFSLKKILFLTNYGYS